MSDILHQKNTAGIKQKRIILCEVSNAKSSPLEIGTLRLLQQIVRKLTKKVEFI